MRAKAHGSPGRCTALSSSCLATPRLLRPALRLLTAEHFLCLSSLPVDTSKERPNREQHLRPGTRPLHGQSLAWKVQSIWPLAEWCLGVSSSAHSRLQTLQKEAALTFTMQNTFLTRLAQEEWTPHTCRKLEARPERKPSLFRSKFIHMKMETTPLYLGRR